MPKVTDNICQVCQKRLRSKEASPSSCNHKFHVKCLTTWIKEHAKGGHCKCPLKSCEKSFEKIEIKDNETSKLRSATSIDNRTECPICWKPITSLVATPNTCSHAFCYSCLRRWVKQKNTCPLDRISFQEMLVAKTVGGDLITRVCLHSIFTYYSSIGACSKWIKKQQ